MNEKNGRWVNLWIDGWVSKWVINGCVDRQMHKWMGRWVDGYMNGCIYVHTHTRIYTHTYLGADKCLHRDYHFTLVLHLWSNEAFNTLGQINKHLLKDNGSSSMGKTTTRTIIELWGIRPHISTGQQRRCSLQFTYFKVTGWRRGHEASYLTEVMDVRVPKSQVLCVLSHLAQGCGWLYVSARILK